MDTPRHPTMRRQDALWASTTYNALPHVHQSDHRPQGQRSLPLRPHVFFKHGENFIFSAMDKIPTTNANSHSQAPRTASSVCLNRQSNIPLFNHTRDGDRDCTSNPTIVFTEGSQRMWSLYQEGEVEEDIDNDTSSSLGTWGKARATTLGVRHCSIDRIAGRSTLDRHFDSRQDGGGMTGPDEQRPDADIGYVCRIDQQRDLIRSVYL